MSSCFFDTNILVYAHDTGDRLKHAVAQDLIHRHVQRHEIVMSTQVLQEFWVAMTKKFGVDKVGVRGQLELLVGEQIVVVQPDDILNAIHWQTQWKISFWDALILISAKRAGASIVYSEDLTHGRSYNGVKVVNPFLPLGN
jgi:predicted nucleic acid-binding protein